MARITTVLTVVAIFTAPTLTTIFATPLPQFTTSNNNFNNFNRHSFIPLSINSGRPQVSIFNSEEERGSESFRPLFNIGRPQSSTSNRDVRQPQLLINSGTSQSSFPNTGVHQPQTFNPALIPSSPQNTFIPSPVPSRPPTSFSSHSITFPFSPSPVPVRPQSPPSSTRHVTSSSRANDCFPNEPTTQGQSDASEGINNFGMEMFKQLSKGENVFFSPYNLWSALIITYMGAEGNTGSQMKNLLGLQGKDSSLDLMTNFERRFASEKAMSEASRVYLQDGYKIKQCVKDLMANKIISIDFGKVDEAANTINHFVKNATHGRIRDIVKPDQLTNTKMAITTAIYFKASWLYTFNKQLTTNQHFRSFNNAVSKPVPMMHVEATVSVGSSNLLDARVLRLPYTSDTLAMYVILPYDEGEAAFKKTVNALSASALNDAKRRLTKRPLDVFLPKFKMETEYGSDLKEAMKNLGAGEMFDSYRADFSSFSPELYVSTIAHKAFVSVNEEGTEAAAATAVLLDVRSGAGPTPFICDRPFVFVIMDESNDVVLFVGAYVTPLPAPAN